MRDIDFLPAEYQEQHARRRSQPWRVLVMAVFLGLVAAAAFGQYRVRWRLRSELAVIEPQRATAVRRQEELAELQARLHTERAEADLITYLRHPWPRTQLLAALLAPLPDELTLEKLQIRRDVSSQPGTTERVSRVQRQAEEQKLAKMPPAARDLRQLKQEYDQRRTIIAVTGVTAESAALHRYLGQLGEDDLFAKVELRSIESVQAEQSGQFRFIAEILVRPGYGQPGGPTGTTSNGTFSESMTRFRLRR